MRAKRLWIDVRADSQIMEEYEGFAKYGVFVGNLFTFYLPKVAVSKMSKIVVEFSQQPDALWMRTSESIHTIQETFPFNKFLRQDFSEKVMLLSESTYKCLIILYKQFNLDLAGLDFGYQQILNNDFKLSRELFKGAKHNKVRTIKAVVIADYLFDDTQIKINFLDKSDKVIREIVLFKTGTGWFYHTLLLKSAKWVDDETFELSNPSKEINFRINVKGNISTRYAPIGRDVDGIQEEIRHYTLERMFEV